MIYHVVAVAQNRVIGKDNKLPWHFSADLKFFKNLTMGQTVIMGRKTFESIGRPLPGRQNFVITHHPKPDAENLRYFSSITEAFRAIQTEQGFVIGGAKIYEATLDQVDGIYLTKIDAAFEGDAFYPEIPESFHGEPKEVLHENPRIQVFLYLRSPSLVSKKNPAANI